MRLIRRVLSGLGALALGLATLAGPAAAQTFKATHVVPADSAFGALVVTFAAEVAKRTNGRIKIIHDPSYLGGEKEICEGLELGTHEIGVLSTGTTGEFGPDTKILDMPFLFRDYAHARAVLDGPIGQDLLKAFAARGLIGIAWADNGFRHLTNNVRPVRTPEDVKDLVIRTQQNPIHQLAFTTLGAVTRMIPFPQLYTALQQGTVDGQENSMAVMVKGGYARVQKHLTLSAHVFSPIVVLVSESVWQSLSPGDRKIFREAIKAGVAANRAYVDRVETEGIAVLQQSGMQVVPEIDRAAFEAALAPAYLEYARMFGQDRIDRIRNFR